MRLRTSQVTRFVTTKGRTGASASSAATATAPAESDEQFHGPVQPPDGPRDLVVIAGLQQRRREKVALAPAAPTKKRAPAPPAPAEPVPEAAKPRPISGIGTTDDTVRLFIAGRELLHVVEHYQITLGVFSQPSAFSLTCGHGGVVADLISWFKPRAKFELRIGNTLVQSGYVDGFQCGGQSATIEIFGRDALQDIHDHYTRFVWTSTQTDHVKFMEEVYERAELNKPVIRESTAALHRLRALGKPLPTAHGASKVREERKIAKPVPVQLGDRFYEIIKRVLDRAGLFFYALPDGTYLISSPDKDQPALYRLVHAPADPRERGTVLDFNYRVSTVERQAYYIAYSKRGGGKKKGSTITHKGSLEDKEMLDWGYKRTRSFRDWHLQTDAQAELMARRKIAEARRAAWSLELQVSGHRIREPSTGELAVWLPDTIVHFDSDQLRLHEDFYIESVTFSRDAQRGTTTSLRLMRPVDLLFGLEDL